MTRQAHNGNYFGARHQPLGGGLLTASEDKSSVSGAWRGWRCGLPEFLQRLPERGLLGSSSGAEQSSAALKGWRSERALQMAWCYAG